MENLVACITRGHTQIFLRREFIELSPVLTKALAASNGEQFVWIDVSYEPLRALHTLWRTGNEPKLESYFPEQLVTARELGLPDLVSRLIPLNQAWTPPPPREEPKSPAPYKHPEPHASEFFWDRSWFITGTEAIPRWWWLKPSWVFRGRIGRFRHDELDLDYGRMRPFNMTGVTPDTFEQLDLAARKAKLRRQVICLVKPYTGSVLDRSFLRMRSPGERLIFDESSLSARFDAMMGKYLNSFLGCVEQEE